MPDLNPYELFKQFSHLFLGKGSFFHPGFIGILYLFHHQLGITAYLQLISFHGVGKIKPGYDSFVLGLFIGGKKSEFECVFHVNPFQGGQNKTRTASLGIGGPIYGQPLDGQVGRQLSSLGGHRRGIWRGEFHDEICQNLPFDRCPWLVYDVELAQLYGPFYQSSRGL